MMLTTMLVNYKNIWPIRNTLMGFLLTVKKKKVYLISYNWRTDYSYTYCCMGLSTCFVQIIPQIKLIFNFLNVDTTIYSSIINVSGLQCCSTTLTARESDISIPPLSLSPLTPNFQDILAWPLLSPFIL